MLTATGCWNDEPFAQKKETFLLPTKILVGRFAKKLVGRRPGWNDTLGRSIDHLKVTSMKKTFLPSCVFVVFAFLWFPVLAQKCTVYYCEGCVRNGLCPVSRTFSSREEAEASARLACPGATPDIRCDNKEHNGQVLKSPIADGIMGGLLFSLIGSFMHDASGKNLWPAYGAGGYFIFSTLPLIVTPKHRPVGENIVIGLLWGAAGGYSGAQAVNQLNAQHVAAGTTPKKIDPVPVTLITAAVGAVTVPLFTPKATKPGASSFHRRPKGAFQPVFAISAGRVGVVIRL